MTKRSTYHHGDLRKALISAGEETLEENGVDGFSLRQVAKRVGVSPSAPAHHFGDTQGLLMAIAAEGFRQLQSYMNKYHARYGPEPDRAFLGSGIGYVEFAKAHPALFNLMFGPLQAEEWTQELREASIGAFEHLAGNMERHAGMTRHENKEVMRDIIATWSTVHGFANLLNSGGLQTHKQLDQQQQATFLEEIIARTFPGKRLDINSPK